MSTFDYRTATNVETTYIPQETDFQSTLHNNTNCSSTVILTPGELIQICADTLCSKQETYVYQFCKLHYPQLDFIIEQELLYSDAHVSGASRVILTILLVAIMVTSLVGNSLVVLTFITNRHMRSTTNVFIVSLAVSDLTFTVTCIPQNIGDVLNNYWQFGRVGCKMIPFVTNFTVACSSLTLCCVAIDRYYAIVHPLKLNFLQAPKRAAILLAVVWIISFGASIPYLIIYDTETVTSKCSEGRHEVCYTPILKGGKEAFDVGFTLVLLFVVPFIFMCVTYGIICCKLWGQPTIGVRVPRVHDAGLRLKRKAIKMLITVMLLFVVCWSPLLVFNAALEELTLAENMHNISLSNIHWRAYLKCLALSSCCVNPVVYSFMNEKFKKAFLNLLACRKVRVYPVSFERANPMRISAESRKTTTQLEPPMQESHQTSETRV
ncbi:hypothetical protein ACJMK2_034691 [Sinanodonta woodiana]|uniref:G-protein coupled receptors family 1 profile domain-containing protein n=1 Tax=Sinanodonta woodiana TaxID=1069815 RepID=A0ABD3WWI7_SINWO